MIRKTLVSAVAILAFGMGSVCAQSPVVAPYFQGNEDAAPPLNHGWQLRARMLSDLGFPAVTLQPLTAGVPMALDLQPLGPNPVESPGNGWTWLDACNKDLMTNNNAQAVCGRVGVAMINGAPAGYVGTENFNGNPSANFWLKTGHEYRWGATFQGDFIPFTDNRYTLGMPAYRIKEIYTVSGPLLQVIQDLKNRIAVLESKVP